MSPIKYLKQGPIMLDKNILSKIKRQITEYNFSLLIDNRELRKPILLPSGLIAKNVKEIKSEVDYFIKEFSFNDIVDNEPLRFSGYLFWQRNQIEPSVIRGLEIYIRNVGIGLFDHTLLNFSTVNPTSRAGQISGEIYVDVGLERALNVDRNSFKETDAHYLALQHFIWKELGSTKRSHGVLGKSVDSYYLRKEKTDKYKTTEHEKSIFEKIEVITNGEIGVDFSDEQSEKPYEIRNKKIRVFYKSDFWPSAISDKHLCQRILIPLKAALLNGATSDELLEILENLIQSN